MNLDNVRRNECAVPINRNTYHDGVVLLIVWGTARDGDPPPVF